MQYFNTTVVSQIDRLFQRDKYQNTGTSYSNKKRSIDYG